MKKTFYFKLLQKRFSSSKHLFVCINTEQRRLFLLFESLLFKLNRAEGAYCCSLEFCKILVTLNTFCASCVDMLPAFVLGSRNETEFEKRKKQKENQIALQLILIVGSFFLGYIPPTGEKRFHIFFYIRWQHASVASC